MSLKSITGQCNTVVDPMDEWRDYAAMKIAEDGFNEKAWIIGHEYGPVAVGLGSCEQDALDDAVDNGALDCMIMSEKDAEEYEQDTGDYPPTAGNASEPLITDYLWMTEV